MPLMLDVSDEVRAEIGDDEANRLIAGENAPDTYDCTSCRTPGVIAREPTSTVLFVGEESAVLAFAHAHCIPSQVVPVTEEQLQGAVRNITRTDAAGPATSAGPAAPAAPSYAQQPAQPMPPAQPAGTPHAQVPQALHSAPPAQSAQSAHFAQSPPDARPAPPEGQAAPQPAVLGITCGLVLCEGAPHPALVVEPTGPIARPGSTGSGDEFLPLLIEQGFGPVHDLERPPAGLAGWSVLLAMGKLHAVLQPVSPGGGQNAWWQAHQPLSVTDEWRNTASRLNRVFVYAAPAGSIGHQPREDLLRDALEKAAAQGLLLGVALPLAGT